jgi:sulfide dehydrogenase cytochrome subunit
MCSEKPMDFHFRGNDGVVPGIRAVDHRMDGAMKSQLLRCAVAIAGLSGLTSFGSAADVGAYANLGRDVAANCANCHGTDGRSRGASPSLAGQDAAVIVQRMKEFRDGRRAATVMQQLAKGYTDAQIEAAAAYFAAQAKQ